MHVESLLIISIPHAGLHILYELREHRAGSPADVTQTLPHQRRLH